MSTEQLLEVQGMTLERYAALGHLLEPFGGQPQLVDGSRIVYRVNGSADQLRRAVNLRGGESIGQSLPSMKIRGGRKVRACTAIFRVFASESSG